MSNFGEISLKKAIYISVVAPVTMSIMWGCKNTTNEKNDLASSNASLQAGEPSITKGFATTNIQQVFDCEVPGWRVTANGNITSEDGRTWTVPADVSYGTSPKATDLFNECTNVLLNDATELDVSDVPIVNIDDEGEVITAYFFGDNYFEFFVNGEIVAVDPVPYWPFNTSAVRFRAKKPFIAGVKMIDWAENLGIGSETMRGVPFHTGDGGFIAVFKNTDGDTIATTDESWRVQPYYMSPLSDPSCIEDGRDSTKCDVPPKEQADQGYGAHWSIPENWGQAGYDDSAWQNATLYTNEEIGGSLRFKSYQNFTGLFDDPGADAEFIWSKNLLLDNVVLARKSFK